MALSPKLLDDPCVPRRQGPAVLPRATRTGCTTRACKRRYDVRDDIPVMLIDEAVTVDDAEHAR